MNSASQLLHGHKASPPVDGCRDMPSTSCWVCGAPWSRGLAVKDFMGANFTGQNRVRAPHSTVVCEPCVWACEVRPPDALRMYTHLYEEGGEP